MKTQFLSSVLLAMSITFISINSVAQSNPPAIDPMEKAHLTDSIALDKEKQFQVWKKKQKAIAAKNQCPSCPLEVMTAHTKKCMSGDINGAVKYTTYKAGDKSAGFIKGKMIEDSKGNYEGACLKLKTGMSGQQLYDKPVVIYCTETVAYVSNILKGVEKNYFLEKVGGVWKITDQSKCERTDDEFMFAMYSSYTDEKRASSFKRDAESKANLLLKDKAKPFPTNLNDYVGMYAGLDGDKDYYEIAEDALDKTIIIMGGYGGNWKLLSVDAASGAIRTEGQDGQKAEFGRFVRRSDGRYDVERVQGSQKVLYKRN